MRIALFCLTLFLSPFFAAAAFAEQQPPPPIVVAQQNAAQQNPAQQNSDLQLYRIESVERRMESAERSAERLLIAAVVLAMLLLAVLLTGAWRAYLRWHSERLNATARNARQLMRDIKAELDRPQLAHLRTGYELRRIMRRLRKGAPLAVNDAKMLAACGTDGDMPASLYLTARALLAETNGEWHLAAKWLDGLVMSGIKDDADVLLHLAHVHDKIALAAAEDAQSRRRHLALSKQYYAQFAFVLPADYRDMPMPQKSSPPPPAEDAADSSPKLRPSQTAKTVEVAAPSPPREQVAEASPPPEEKIADAPPKAQLSQLPQTAEVAESPPPPKERVAESPPKSQPLQTAEVAKLPPAKTQVAASPPPKEKVAESPPKPQLSQAAQVAKSPPPAKSQIAESPPPPKERVAESPPPPQKEKAAESSSPPKTQPSQKTEVAAPLPAKGQGAKSPPPPKEKVAEAPPKSQPPQKAEVATSPPAKVQIAESPPPPKERVAESPLSKPQPAQKTQVAESPSKLQLSQKAAVADAPPKSQPPQKEQAAESPPPKEKAAESPSPSPPPKQQYESAPAVWFADAKQIAEADREKPDALVKKAAANARYATQDGYAALLGYLRGGNLPLMPLVPILPPPAGAKGAPLLMWGEIAHGNKRMYQAALALSVRARNRHLDAAILRYGRAQTYHTNDYLCQNFGLAHIAKALHAPAAERKAHFQMAAQMFLAGNAARPHYFDFSLAVLFALADDGEQCRKWLQQSPAPDKKALRGAEFDNVRGQKWFAEFAG